MADISSPTQTSLDIFRAIMDYGPLTLYSANNKTRMSIGTLHRHFKHLSKSGKIRVYESNKKGRKKIEYGPTILGMVTFYRQDKKFAKNIENYFLLWIKNKEFQKELELEGFDVSDKNLKNSKHVFKTYMDYFGAVEDQIERIMKGEDIISHNLQVFIGVFLLSSYPYYQKLWTELYNNLPLMQSNCDDYMQNMIKQYKEFKKQLKTK